MDSNTKYKSSLAFTDLLFNILLGFAFMFLIAFILINPIQKDADIEVKAEFMVIMEWDDTSYYDVDLWMEDPIGNKVGFPNMHAGFLHLDKDDLGTSNDTVIMPDGTKKTIYLNREVMTIRGTAPGEYIVNNHLYSIRSADARDGRTPIEVITKVLKLNPYSEIHVGVVVLTHTGDEETVIRFRVNDQGHVIGKNKRQTTFASSRRDSLRPGASSGINDAREVIREEIMEITPSGLSEPAHNNRYGAPTFTQEPEIPADVAPLRQLEYDPLHDPVQGGH